LFVADEAWLKKLRTPDDNMVGSFGDRAGGKPDRAWLFGLVRLSV